MLRPAGATKQAAAGLWWQDSADAHPCARPTLNYPTPQDSAIWQSHPPKHNEIPARVIGAVPQRRKAVPPSHLTSAAAVLTGPSQAPHKNQRPPKYQKALRPSHSGHHQRWPRQWRVTDQGNDAPGRTAIPRLCVFCQSRAPPIRARCATPRLAGIVWRALVTPNHAPDKAGQPPSSGG